MPWETCAICGYVRRRDGKNKPCPGPVRVGPRANPVMNANTTKRSLSSERAAAMGRAGAGRPKHFSEEERARRRERMARINEAKRARASAKQQTTCEHCGCRFSGVIHICKD